MKILHFSDSHGLHRQLEIPEGIDLIIFSGDESNHRNPVLNEPESRDFLEWFAQLKAEHKVMVAGNHSTAIEKRLVTKAEIEKMGICYLENEEVSIDGLKIWGSPFSPTFGDWAFMKSRGKLPLLWEQIPKDTDIVVTHTPPMGILDLTYDLHCQLQFCGCRNLLKQIRRIHPVLHLFGHIHNQKEIHNAGSTTLSGSQTIFSNGCVVTDFKLDSLSSHGNVFNL